MKQIYFLLLNLLMALCEPEPDPYNANQQNYPGIGFGSYPNNPNSLTNNRESMYIPKHLINMFGAHPTYQNVPNPGGSNTFTKTKTSTKTFTKTKTPTRTFTKNKPRPLPPSSHIEVFGTENTRYSGGCTMPNPPVNSNIRCSDFTGGCRITCIPNYQFPNGDKILFITCHSGEWQVEGTEWSTIPACEPICYPRCLNNGICIAPNQCNCPENFSGPQCQFENKPCMNLPPMPLNSRRSCGSTSCTINCLSGHQFPDGSAITNMMCKDGLWVPAREDWVAIPDCEPSCNPPCQNGGNCLSFNMCQCPQDFRGPQCQYSADACSARKLQFNGGYNCSGMGETFSCTISCSEGVSFEFPPAPMYTCTYETGVFLPSPIPQCVYATEIRPTQIFPPDINIIYGRVNTSIEIGNSFGGEQFNTVNNVIPDFSHPKPPSPPEKLVNESYNFINRPGNGQYPTEFIFVEQKQPTPGICFTWGGSHYKTFDGKVFSFDSSCSHTLVRDSEDNTFNIIAQNNKECQEDREECYRIIRIFLQDKEYVLQKTENGLPVFVTQKKIYPLPVRFPGIRAEMSAHYFVVRIDPVGATVKWDGQLFVQIEVKENLWNRTEGLCGILDGNPNNDMRTKNENIPKNIITFATDWEVDTLGETCNKLPTEEHACVDTNIKNSFGNNAMNFCQKLLTDKRFKVCHAVMDVSILLNACRWDYCNCPAIPEQCACQTLNVYVRECAHKGVKSLAKWRDEQFCPLQCTGGRVYMPCAPPGGQEVCGDVHEKTSDEDTCEEGCYCPRGTVLHNSECITVDKCPCFLRRKEFPAGSVVPKDCNTCTCVNGKWICTQIACGGRCSALGDPHYLTFDGKRYNFMGRCSYYLVKHDNFSIEAENVPCAGAISQAMDFPVNIGPGLPSCTKTVTIKINGQLIKLKQNHEAVVNGQEVTKIPYKIAGINIRTVSSIFLLVELPNKIEVWWDGFTRVYIDVPASFKGETKGLCGTFNNNQKDDFLTPEGDVEKTPELFANKWKTAEKCSDVPEKIESHPCDTNIQNKAIAIEHCSVIKSKQFEECHWHVDPKPFYEDCLYDVCSCDSKIAKCLCPMISAYAHECALKGIKIDWRNDVRECGIHCPGGQKYQICGNSCTRTCSEVAFNPDCKRVCVEGCNCPEGEALDEYGECIPIGQCNCQYEGLEFPAGYKEIRPASKGLELCTCLNAQWNCRSATEEEIEIFPAASDLKTKCDASKNMEFTTCEPAEPVTCKNMHSMELFSASVCHPGCQCKEGFVYDSHNKECVKPTECPCHHGGRSYGENAVVQSDCNTCTCKQGKWECTQRQCAAECSAWGDSHYATFDGKSYDYQGQCDYVLAKGVLGPDESFDISIQNVPCGSLGVSCSKSITISIGDSPQQETITLTREKAIPEHVTLKRLTIRQKGLFVIVEASELGLVTLWDKGTRIYVKLEPRWKEKVKGLCGNYNDNENDDFQTPSGGITEVSAQVFGDSWRLQSYCPEAIEISNTCEQRPDRKVWAVKKCGILKSPLFAPCHSEVPIDDYLQRCIFDTCACDQGGDCECLCTALAAYAQECNSKGVPIKWRSQELCPMQCDERCAKYSPCISTCPVETCDNLLIKDKLSKLCDTDSCIEGCEVKSCPPDQVYLNSSMLECVPKSVCKTVCLEIGNVTYYEGDEMEADDCHTCFCSRGQKICQGQPCTTFTIPTTSTTSLPKQQEKQCVDGWTVWINQDVLPSKMIEIGQDRKFSDIEPLPDSTILLNACSVKEMVDIECRTVSGHKNPKETGLNVECSLEKGLVCDSRGDQPECEDFEIRVKCLCAKTTTSFTTEATEKTKTVPTTVELTTLGSTTTESTSEKPTPPLPCDSSIPYKEHPIDCQLFYQCTVSESGESEWVIKSCAPDTFYNPQTQVCDWPASVIKIKPECGKETSPTTVSTTQSTTISTSEPLVTEPTGITCRPGESFYRCALDCTQMCLYYNYLVKQNGKCQHYEECEAGCISDSRDLSCPPGMLWSSNQTCVQKKDCMCVSNQGKPVKPGTVVRESNCIICQCIDNYYTCDRTACVTQQPIISPTTKSSVIETTATSPVVTSASTPPSTATTEEETKPTTKSSVAETTATSPVVTSVSTPPSTATTEKEIKSTATTPSTIFPITISTVTPPPECDENRFIYLINGDVPLPDEVFSASSTLGDGFAPKFARLNSTLVGYSAGSWSPEVSDGNQYLQIDLPQQEPVYGVILRGSPLFEEFVTSYKVAYSPDGNIFSYVTDRNNQPQVFRGPVDNNKPARQLFDVPVEAQIVKILPLTWHGGIAVRVELIGCAEFATTETTVITPKLPTKLPICDDDMGVDNGMMADQQISVSSIVNPGHDKTKLKINGDSFWQPLTNSPTEWIQFDFLEPRNLTGFVSKGGPDGWVTLFEVEFSPDGKAWNPILDSTGNKKEFPGNYDQNSIHVNYFNLPIQAVYLKIIPIKWNDNIEIRIEPLGCFEPYPTAEISTETPSTVGPKGCESCPGAPSAEMELGACRCEKGLLWDGENCVPRSQCPCIVGHMQYAVGLVFEKEDCSQCICKLGGVEYCTPKVCDKCEEGLQSVVTGNCHCMCRPCDKGTTLCATSNICINSTLWCDGVEDCSDDEINCISTSTTPTMPTIEPIIGSTQSTTVQQVKCPTPTCPPGYRVKEKKTSKTERLHSNLSTMFSVYGRKASRRSIHESRYTKGGVKSSNFNKMPKRPAPSRKEKPPKEQKCPEFTCESIKPPPPYINGTYCPPVMCPIGYTAEYVGSTKKFTHDCPKFTCKPPTIPDYVCNVTGRTFNTFDGTEYKYDICDHILARDLETNVWDVSLKKNCTEVECYRDLIIRLPDDVFIFHPDLSIEIDKHPYTREQAKRISSHSVAFMISQLGDALLFVSNRHGFWVIWDNQQNVRVGVTGKLETKVDGLCGYFNLNPKDDKSKPDGTLAKTTAEFGNSWGQAEHPELCEARTCPTHIQNKAWEMCHKVKDITLAACTSKVDIDAYISRCLETTCNCLQTNKENATDENQCRCEAIQSFVVECLMRDSELELSDWRMQHDCPVTCEAPLVHYDCYRRRCEPSCESLSDPNSCPKLPQVCFPGCYCPPGYVRKGGDCILPSTCRDCECNVLPHLQYISYDESNFTVNGNCVYVMSRDVEQKHEGHKFQVLITNHPCEDNQARMCVGKVTILYKHHKIHILRDNLRNKLKIIVDAEYLEDFREVEEWMEIKEEIAKHLKIILHEVQVEVSVYFPSLGVSVKAPSLKYSGKLEGLCGDCNGNIENDFNTPSGTPAPNVEEFALSWLYDKLPGGQTREQCASKPEETCISLPIDHDPCLLLVDIDIFGQCHLVLDPMVFIDWCKKDTCNGKPEGSCESIETYARECAQLGFCTQWRNNLCPAKECPPDLEYKPCAPKCVKTCENINDENSQCKNLPLEGCFCPEGKVLLNNTCVDKRFCLVCDEEGHHPGDVWQKDKCTTCKCEETTVTCEVQSCPSIATVCEPGYYAVKTETNKTECCDKYICIPVTPSPTCEPLQELQCGRDQVTKLITKPDGCQQFVCECKPVEECEPTEMSTVTPLEPGIERVVNNNGCCPFIEEICKVETCPKAKDCPKYHTLQNNTSPSNCCPKYDCVPPTDECIIDLKYIDAEKGGERPRNKYEELQVLKKINETWKDGPCRECKCVWSSSNKPSQQCSIIECPSIENSPDITDFVLEEVLIQGQCCPEINRSACKHENKVYQPGEKWPAGEGDYCTNLECMRSSEGIQKERQTISCDTDCDIGWEYQPATPDSKQCCGSCKPVACVIDGITHKIGEKWTSEDYCINYSCLNINGSLQVQSVIVNCPEIPEELLKDYIYESVPVEGQCCKKNKAVACRVNGTEYKVGETWPSPDGDKCKSYVCTANELNEIIKQESVETCNKNCSKGWEYKESETACCGKCEPVACIMGDVVKYPNETWKSEDGCTTFTCELFGDQLTVQNYQESCPNIDYCPLENIYLKGCCKHCNITSLPQVTCEPKALRPEDTIGLVKVTRPAHGKCINKNELKNFTECIGQCHSSTTFNTQTGSHESICTCCQATQYHTIMVTLECEDGHLYKKPVAVPVTCGCEGCFAKKKEAIKTGVKTG